MLEYPDLLFIVLVVFVVLRAVVATVSKTGREWFKGIPVKQEIEHYRAARANNLTLAGFSLAALTLFLTIGSSPLDPTRTLLVRDTALYLSISLVCFIIAAYLYPLALRRYFSYIADTLEWLGLLSIGLAMLLFFLRNFAEITDIQIVYWTLFVVIIVIGWFEIILYTRMLENIKKAQNSKATEDG